MPDRRPMTVTDLWDLCRVGQPAPAPDGSFVIVPVTNHAAGEPKPRTALYRVAGDGSADPLLLTSPEASCSGPAVSPDGRRLAFLRKRPDDEHAQLAVMPLDGGEARAITDMPLGVTEARWLPDGSGLILLAPLLVDALDVAGTRELAAKRKDEPVQAKVTEDNVYRYWDRWLVGGSVHHLFRLGLADGALTDLMPESAQWFNLMDPTGSWDVSPDGTEVAYAVDISQPPHERLGGAVHTVPADGTGAPRRLSDDPPANQARPRYSPDGRWLLYGMQREYDFYADPFRLVRYDRQRGEEAVLTDGWDRSAAGWEFAADSSTIVMSAHDHSRSRLFTLPVAGGTPEQLVEGGWAQGPRPASGHVYFSTSSLRAPAEVARVAIGGGDVEPVTAFNAALVAEIEFGTVREMEFAGAAGDTVQAFVVHPPGYEEGRRYPLVHLIHGGPHSVFGDEWHPRWNAQTFAAHGYVVCLVNFHGSTGRGYDFTAGIHGGWGDMPAADLLAATDELVGRGTVDPDRMAIAGGSYGGYLVAWLTGLTNRFAAAVCHAGVTNLIGQYGSDITQGRSRSMGADVWEDTDAVLRWSPTAHTKAMETPTLVIHGEQDYRVLHTQGLELYGILKAKGVDARLVYYPDEGHWILKRPNSELWYGEVLGWLERYLR